MTDKKRRISIMLVCLLMSAAAFAGYFFSAGEKSDFRHDAKDYILANHCEETGAVNAVTSIYLNYRLWDTLFEAMVLLLLLIVSDPFRTSGLIISERSAFLAVPVILPDTSRLLRAIFASIRYD